nr:hypothetical protein [Streptococcus equi]
MLEDELLQNKAVYIVVNKQKALPKAVKKIVTANYKLTERLMLRALAYIRKNK